MNQPVGLDLVVICWAVFCLYVFWDLYRIRANARRDLNRLLKTLADSSEAARKRLIREHLDRQTQGYRRFRSRPLWQRWTESMARTGNLIFGILLGISAITTLAWWDQESMRLWLNWCIALVVCVGSLAVVALILRRIF
ncbi:MAG: hypothetical protein R3200_07215 [Xanthomonadales bacterium]|nr:hypothetical protein [Xanthomonadales bacterium]